jgi:hypothetical protein
MCHNSLFTYLLQIFENFFLVGLWFELQVLCLQSRHSSFTTPPVHFALVILVMVSHELFAQAGLEPQSSWSQPVKQLRLSTWTMGTWLNENILREGIPYYWWQFILLSQTLFKWLSTSTTLVTVSHICLLSHHPSHNYWIRGRQGESVYGLTRFFQWVI